jgi:hypothetical protein
MIDQKGQLRNHMLAATMHGRWETMTEILRALRKDGVRCLRNDAWKLLVELSQDGVHDLQHRVRAGANHKEYRLYVKTEKIMETRPYARPALPLPKIAR